MKMAPFAQVAVGAFLLVGAFILGSHINGNSPVANQGAQNGSPNREDALDDKATVAQLEPTSAPDPFAGAAKPKPLQRSLRDRLLGAPNKYPSSDNKIEDQDSSDSPFADSPRPFEPNDPEPTKPKTDNTFDQIAQGGPASNSELKNRSGPIVEPDFSGLASQLGRAPADNRDRGDRDDHWNRLNDKLSTSNQRVQNHFRPLGPLRLNKQPTSHLVPVRPRLNSNISLETSRFLRHTTEPGDTLQKIAERYYGKADFYLDIYLANQDNLENPSSLLEGMVLKIPVYD